ncbi:expressed protein [Phakopsora pachyrhizi]|uniref:Expressed protein n=1 Tax=Phakopsora pachyrhizi TaxID=170000 RepID=A0AAV0B0R1_PHAPC|nr:expressed protein [Phakopsora pachyrhizi]
MIRMFKTLNRIKFSTTSSIRSHIGSKPIEVPSDLKILLITTQQGTGGTSKDQNLGKRCGVDRLESLKKTLIVEGRLGRMRIDLKPFIDIRFLKKTVEGLKTDENLGRISDETDLIRSLVGEGGGDEGTSYDLISSGTFPGTLRVLITSSNPSPSQHNHHHHHHHHQQETNQTKRVGTVVEPSRRVFVDEKLKRFERSMWGLTRSLISNSVTGTTVGFESTIELVGVGYRATLEDVPILNNRLIHQPTATSSTTHKTRADDDDDDDDDENLKARKKRLNLRVGYSHPILIDLPSTNSFLSCDLVSNSKIILRGIDKQELGLFCASIRRFRPPEPYNGKGIYLNGETVKRKEARRK